MFNFKRAALTLITLLAFAGLIVGTVVMVASAFTGNATAFAVGTMVLILSLSVVAGLPEAKPHE